MSERTMIPEEGESARWEGRPAPRCYTFRNWRHSLFGLLLLGLSLFWQVIGAQLAVEYDSQVLAWLPAPFLLAGLFFAFGHLILARLEWEKVFYSVTDRRILVRRGLLGARLEAMSLDEVTYFSLKSYGEELGTLRVHGGDSRLTLCCIEYPRQVTVLLEEAMKESGALAPETGKAEGVISNE